MHNIAVYLYKCLIEQCRFHKHISPVGKLAVHQYLRVQFDAAVDPCTELVECPIAQAVQEVSVVVPVLYWSAGHCVQVPPFI